MTEEISEGQLPILLLSSANYFRRTNTLEKRQEHFLKDVVVLYLSLHDEGDRSEVVIALVPQGTTDFRLSTATTTNFRKPFVLNLWA